jgi:hypothetical protein
MTNVYVNGDPTLEGFEPGTITDPLELPAGFYDTRSSRPAPIPKVRTRSSRVGRQPTQDGWQLGHAKIIRPASFHERIRVPQRRHGRPARR